MPERPGPFSVIEIAQKLARPPGRMEFDRAEALRVAKDMFEALERGDIGSEEVVAQFGDPPRWGTTAEAKEDARRQGLEWKPIDFTLWYATLWLTRTAVKQYLEASTLASAPRLLREWFPDPPAEAAATSSVESAAPEPKEAVKATRPRAKPGPKPKLRNCLAAQMLGDLRS